ncbi:MAG: interphotoreceptor retinoid-binding protein [bacterium]|nr:MAG: interphotoreceptor retinoid-binding protein [bacterium]
MIRRLVPLLALPFLAANALAQGHGMPQPVDRPTGAPENRALVDSLSARLSAEYVFPEVAAAMVKSLKAGRNRYEKITSSIDLANTLTDDLEAISHDKHLRIVYREQEIAERNGEEFSPGDIAAHRKESRIRNHGFEKIERMMGNVGYLEMRSFAEPANGAAETATAAMNFLGNVDALIIDLRRNGGGSPDMVALVTSYLYGAGERVHLNDLYWRSGDRTEQFWTVPSVTGPRLDGKDVYILTSSFTFSAAEEFCYNLKNLERATLVGDTTGGGAHPGALVRLADHFEMFCPTGRAINPISKTNWEGTGVTPDMPCPADDALTLAHVTAIEKLLTRADDPDDRQRLTMALDRVKADAVAPTGDTAPPGGPARIIVRGN